MNLILFMISIVSACQVLDGDRLDVVFEKRLNPEWNLVVTKSATTQFSGDDVPGLSLPKDASIFNLSAELQSKQKKTRLVVWTDVLVEPGTRTAQLRVLDTVISGNEIMLLISRGELLWAVIKPLASDRQRNRTNYPLPGWSLYTVETPKVDGQVSAKAHMREDGLWEIQTTHTLDGLNRRMTYREDKARDAMLIMPTTEADKGPSLK